jgi:hypothetical protein
MCASTKKLAICLILLPFLFLSGFSCNDRSEELKNQRKKRELLAEKLNLQEEMTTIKKANPNIEIMDQYYNKRERINEIDRTVERLRVK